MAASSRTPRSWPRRRGGRKALSQMEMLETWPGGRSRNLRRFWLRPVEEFREMLLGDSDAAAPATDAVATNLTGGDETIDSRLTDLQPRRRLFHVHGLSPS